MVPFNSIKSLKDLGNWLADVMENDTFLDWPLYNGELGSDSAGGTNVGTYSKLNRTGVLTLGSQDGFCTQFGEEPNLNFLNYMLKLNVIKSIDDVVDVRELQISYLDCLMPLRLFELIIPELIREMDTIQTIITYHPKLGDDITYSFDKKGNLIAKSRPHLTTNVFILKNGQIISDNQIGTSMRDIKQPTHLSDLAHKYKTFRQYTSIIQAFNRFGTHPKLMRELIDGTYVTITFYSSKECTFPHTVGDKLYEILQRVLDQNYR